MDSCSTRSRPHAGPALRQDTALAALVEAAALARTELGAPIGGDVLDANAESSPAYRALGAALALARSLPPHWHSSESTPKKARPTVSATLRGARGVATRTPSLWPLADLWWPFLNRDDAETEGSALVPSPERDKGTP